MLGSDVNSIGWSCLDVCRRVTPKIEFRFILFNKQRWHWTGRNEFLEFGSSTVYHLVPAAPAQSLSFPGGLLPVKPHNLAYFPNFERTQNIRRKVRIFPVKEKCVPKTM